MKIINKSKIFFTISGTLFIASVLVWIALGLDLGIDFTGGSLLEIEYIGERPSQEVIKEQLSELDLGSINIQPIEQNGYNLRFKDVNETTHQAILTALQPAPEEGTIAEKEIELEAEKSVSDPNIVIEGSAATEKTQSFKEKRFTSIGPVIGQELKKIAVELSLAVIIAIVLYVAWAFRKVSYPVQSWKYGVISIIALIHDVVITIGIFIILGQVFNFEINAPFVAAILTILGYSVNDTIVTFDRVRENLHKYEGDFDEIIDKSIQETVTRSINTSLTTLLVLISILVFGGESIKDFVLALIIGIILGTYSSIFIAAPLLVTWQKLSWKLKRSHT